MTAEIGSIFFPMGGAGNHLRWLLFLDKKFETSICDNSIETKLDFIQNKVYNQKRTWYNWLGNPGSTDDDDGFEWQYREKLNSIIAVDHLNFNWENTTGKELYLTYKNYDNLLQHYFHINLGLNSSTPEKVKQLLKVAEQECKFLENKIHKFPGKKLLFADKLFDKDLDYTFYKETVDFFEFEDCYTHAQKVHKLYYQCRVRSANDFYNYFTGLEFNKYLEGMRELANSNGD